MVEKEKYRYCFPDFLAKAMRKVDLRTQMEASLLSAFLILFSLLLMSIYILIFGTQTWPFKIVLVINMICGFAFLSSNLLTQYQQYVNYMETMGIDPEAHKREIRKRGNLIQRIVYAIRHKNDIKNQMINPTINQPNVQVQEPQKEVPISLPIENFETEKPIIPEFEKALKEPLIKKSKKQTKAELEEWGVEAEKIKENERRYLEHGKE